MEPQLYYALASHEIGSEVANFLFHKGDFPVESFSLILTYFFISRGKSAKPLLERNADFVKMLINANPSSIPSKNVPKEIIDNLGLLVRYPLSNDRLAKFTEFFFQKYFCVPSNSLPIEGQFSVVTSIDYPNMSDSTKTARHSIYNRIHPKHAPGIIYS